jgi:hypothetical protein
VNIRLLPSEITDTDNYTDSDTDTDTDTDNIHIVPQTDSERRTHDAVREMQGFRSRMCYWFFQPVCIYTYLLPTLHELIMLMMIMNSVVVDA